MQAKGTLDKMPAEFSDPVRYKLRLGGHDISMNELVGRPVSLRFTGNIYCCNCGKKTSKSFGEGFCYNCFANSPENAECIIRPELCLAHELKGRDVEWEISHHLKPHFVYLALVNETKVGVTRDSQIPTRWIDQGANKAIILAETPYRQLAGLIEVALKEFVADKTNWSKMLRNEFNPEIDLLSEKRRISALIPENLQQYISADDKVTELHYPVAEYPQKVSSLGFDKQALIDGKLTGIRAQYLLFEGGKVVNIRKHTGYEVELAC